MVNHWKGFVLGIVGGIAGLAAMDMYWKRVAPWVSEKFPDSSIEKDPDQSRKLDDISIAGPKYEEGETSTETLGRMVHKAVTGSTPRSKEGLTFLSYLVHYLYGLIQGGIYGASRAQVPPRLDVFGGSIFGAGLWLLGDEFVVPLLGLQKGPTAVSVGDHVNRLGAHLTYGCTTAITTQLLNKFI